MPRPITLLALMSSLLGAVGAEAAFLTTWEVQIEQQQNVLEQFVPVSIPADFEIQVTIADTVTAVVTGPIGTATLFGANGDTSIESQTEDYVGDNPLIRSGYSEHVTRRDTTFSTLDHGETIDQVPFGADEAFVEEIVVYEGEFYTRVDDSVWAQDLAIALRRTSPTRGAAAETTYPGTREVLKQLLKELEESPEEFEVRFSHRWALYSGVLRRAVSGAWWTGSARLVEVVDTNPTPPADTTPTDVDTTTEDDPAPEENTVPEPGSVALALAAACGAQACRRRRRVQ